MDNETSQRLPGAAAAGAPEAFHVLVKPFGPVCNLRCRYCYYLDKAALYPDQRDFRMPPQVLESFTRQYIESQPTPKVSFAWQGGEPTLLGVEFFREALRLQKQHCPERKQIENCIQTNGTVLDDAWCEFLRENEFLVGLSLDGPRQVHDAYRLDAAGRGSFDRVLAALRLLRQQEVKVNILTVVHRASVGHAREVYSFFREEGVEFIQFIPLVRREARASRDVTEETPDPKAFGQFLCGVFDEWVKGDIGKVFVQTFEVALARWLRLPANLCVHDKSCGRAVLLEHNGDLYSCDHFVFPENLLGNILRTPLAELVGSQRQRGFGRGKHESLPRRCRDCDVLFVCRGACPKDRFLPLPGEEHPLNYLCEGYRAFFRHVAPTMQRMAQEMIRQRDMESMVTKVSGRPPGRNDPCPCGSAKKYKHCCGKAE